MIADESPPKVSRHPPHELFRASSDRIPTVCGRHCRSELDRSAIGKNRDGFSLEITPRNQASNFIFDFIRSQPLELQATGQNRDIDRSGSIAQETRPRKCSDFELVSASLFLGRFDRFFSKTKEDLTGMRDKHPVTEEPCEAKVSHTVLKTSRRGDSLA